MANKQNSSTFFSTNNLHFFYTLPLKLRVPHGKHFVDDEDLRFEVGGYGEAQAHFHAGGVELDGRVDILLHPAEVDDLVKFAVDLAAGHAEDGAVHIDVLAARQFGVEAGADLQQGGDAPSQVDLPAGRLGDAREDLQQGAFPCAVMPDDAQHFPLLHVEVDVFQRPEYAVVLFVEAAEAAQLAQVAQRRFDVVQELGGEGIVALFLQPNAVALGQVAGLDDGKGQGVEVKGLRLKVKGPGLQG